MLPPVLGILTPRPVIGSQVRGAGIEFLPSSPDEQRLRLDSARSRLGSAPTGWRVVSLGCGSGSSVRESLDWPVPRV